MSEETKQDPQAQKLWDDLSAEVNQNYSEEFKAMIHSDEWQINGQTFHFQFQNHKRLGELKKLEAEVPDETTNWEGYTLNYKQRGKLLIKELTDEIFNELEFYPLENLITAWAVRARRGFRKSKSGTNNDLPNGSQG